jgi:hypothetical protein
MRIKINLSAAEILVFHAAVVVTVFPCRHCLLFRLAVIPGRPVFV